MIQKKDEGKKERTHRPDVLIMTLLVVEKSRKKAFAKLQAGWIVGEKGVELAVCQELHLTE